MRGAGDTTEAHGEVVDRLEQVGCGLDHVRSIVQQVEQSSGPIGARRRGGTAGGADEAQHSRGSIAGDWSADEPASVPPTALVTPEHALTDGDALRIDWDDRGVLTADRHGGDGGRVDAAEHT